MSRVQKFGTRRSSGAGERAAREAAAALEAAGEDAPLPARRLKHPSNKQQMTKWFYRLLIALFLALMVGLLLWGRKHAEF